MNCLDGSARFFQTRRRYTDLNQAESIPPRWVLRLLRTRNGRLNVAGKKKERTMIGKFQQMLSRTAAALVACAMLGACATEKLLHADFNCDTVGAPPDTTLPGAPSGDKIWVPVVSQLMVVQSAELNSKALSHRNLDVPTWDRHVGFYSATTTLPADQIFRAWWNGRIDLTSTGSGLDVRLSGPIYPDIVAFRFKDGQVRLQTSDGWNPTWETIGTYNESEIHTVIITVDKAAAQYSLVIIPGPVLSGWRPVLDMEGLKTLVIPTLYFWYYEDGKYGAGKYVVDNISIEKVQ
jgi:hypothetical protein